MSRQYIGEIERGEKTNPGAAVLERIARALGWANFHVMMEGGGLVAPPSDEERRARGVAEARLGRVVNEGETPDDLVRAVPLVGRVTAGSGSGSGGQVEEYVYIPKDDGRGKNLRAVRVSGDCMLPVLYSGDIVIYEVTEAQDEVQSGALCVVTLLDEGDGDGGNVKWVDWMGDAARLRAEDPETPAKMVARERLKVEGRVWRMIREF